MQLLIDVNEETPVSLRLAASVLLIMAGAEAMTEDEIHAAARRPAQPAKPMHPTPPPVGKPSPVVAPPAPLPAGNEPVAPVQHPERHPDAPPPPPADVPAGTDLDPTQVFAKGGTPAPLAPAPSVTQTAGNLTDTLERDSAGLPWDSRVHSETKKRNADGTWRFRRNLDEGVKKTVMAELRATYSAQQQIPAVPAAPAAPAAPPPPAAAAPAAPPPPAEDNSVRYDGNTPTVIPPAPAAASVPVQPAASVGMPNTSSPGILPAVTSFRDLMQKVNVALAQGKLTQPQLAEACKSAGVEGIAALAAQPMLVPTVDQYLNRWLAVAA